MAVWVFSGSTSMAATRSLAAAATKVTAEDGATTQRASPPVKRSATAFGSTEFRASGSGGATGSVATAASAPIAIPQQIWMANRTDNQPGDGTIGNPFNASGPGFDAKLRELYLSRVTQVSIHLMAGTYETLGAHSFFLLTGWRIIGAGMELTTVRLSPSFNRPVVVLGTPYWEEGIEVTDLTVDCNYHPDTNPNTSAAVNIAGTRHAIRRVKAINAYGHLPYAEVFIIAIANGGRVSEGNVIEDCEVSSFKGNYCSAIALAAPPGTLNTISGIVRGNHVYDLSSSVGDVAGIAYGMGNIKNVLIENNVAFRCSVAVNVDTGRSLNVIFRNNQFVEVQTGITLAGGDLDNFVLENNYVEVIAPANSYGILVGDLGGRNKLKNFKISHNTLRSRNNLASGGGGIAVVVETGSTFTINDNRVDANLRNWLACPGAQVFNNTDFSGHPFVLTENSRVTPIDLPRGQPGVLLLDRGESYLVVTPGNDPDDNGRKLLAAYERAAASTPHGQPLSAVNRSGLILMPGTYRLADSAFVLHTRYVDVTGAAGAQAIRLESPGNTLVQIATDIVLENLTLHSSSTAPRNNNQQDKSAYFPADNLVRTVIKSCIFSSSQNGLSMRTGITYSGHYESCRAGPQSWGGPGNFAGSAVACHAGPYSFASTGWFTGFATNCAAGEGSFGGAAQGAAGFHGLAKGCTAGHASFGGSGTMINCDVSGAVSSGVPTTGKLTDCRIGPAPGHEPAVLIGPGAILYNCTLLANAEGNGFSVDAVGSTAAKIAHCRMNHGMRNVVNLIQQPGNVDDLAVE